MSITYCISRYAFPVRKSSRGRLRFSASEFRLPTAGEVELRLGQLKLRMREPRSAEEDLEGEGERTFPWATRGVERLGRIRTAQSQLNH